MKIQNVKGGYDFLPKEQKIRNYINDTLREIFEQYGYNPIETPILCYYDILSDKYDEENDILKEIYKLKDQGNRSLGLRYDLTVPFAKLIALNKNNINMPFKRYEIAKSFRDGPVKVGRDREFTQCDVDVCGLSGQMIEAELLTLYEKAFKKLGIEIVIKYNSRNLMNGLILESGVNKELLSCVTTIVDKIEKLSKEEFISYLKELGIDNICKFTSSLARGQNYYTGNVFEVYEKNGKIGGSIGAGGRYDKMITNFIDDGNEYPTVGISFGLSSIYELLKNNERFEEKSNVDIFVIPMNTNVESLKLANKLRELGYKVDVEMRNKKLRKSLDYANKEKIPYVIILGKDEVKNNFFMLKNMFGNKEFKIELNDLDLIKKIIML